MSALMTVIASNVDTFNDDFGARGIDRIMTTVQHMMRRNSKKQSRKNIEAHYDLGNTFYELDEPPAVRVEQEHQKAEVIAKVFNGMKPKPLVESNHFTCPILISSVENNILPAVKKLLAKSGCCVLMVVLAAVLSIKHIMFLHY